MLIRLAFQDIAGGPAKNDVPYVKTRAFKACPCNEPSELEACGTHEWLPCLGLSFAKGLSNESDVVTVSSCERSDHEPFPFSVERAASAGGGFTQQGLALADRCEDSKDYYNPGHDRNTVKVLLIQFATPFTLIEK